MPRESKAAKAARAEEIWELLVEAHPDAHCELDHRNPFELAVATILSAQTTDVRVNMTTPALFERYPDAESLAAARQEDVEELLKSIGLFRSKAKNIIGFAQGVLDRSDGELPRTLKELVSLPGIGRKTANVVLGNAFDINEGVVVDTHVARLAQRLELVLKKTTTPPAIERELMALFPRERWTLLSHLLIFHGRRVCDARKPACERCTVSHLCPASRV